MSVNVVPSGSGSAGLLDIHVAGFFEHLRAAGYAEGSLGKRRSTLCAFVRWTKRVRLSVEDIDESSAAKFLRRTSRNRQSRVAVERATVRLFVAYLRQAAGFPCTAGAVKASPVDALLRTYVDYLRGEQGLAENSIRVYAPYVKGFLAEWLSRRGCVVPQQLDAPSVHAYVIDHSRRRSSQYARLLGASLRSFLRFLYVRGNTATDFSFAVPTVRRWRQATVPGFLSAEEVERTLAMTDRTNRPGRRDYAVLLLLARLGLRASEVVQLNLDDIRWRSAEMIVHGKGGVLDRVPLLSDIGEALALYIRKDRGQTACRRVFLRTWAPRAGFSGPAAVGHIVRAALARAGIRRASRGAAHLFRHSLATQLIRDGASIAEISELLRHRSQGSTEIYAKVAFESLREVARPWPGTGGLR